MDSLASDTASSYAARLRCSGARLGHRRSSSAWHLPPRSRSILARTGSIWCLLTDLMLSPIGVALWHSVSPEYAGVVKALRACADSQQIRRI